MDQCPDARCTQSDKGKDSNPSEQTNLPSPAFYAHGNHVHSVQEQDSRMEESIPASALRVEQHSAAELCAQRPSKGTDSTGKEYLEALLAAVAVHYSDAGCSQSEHGNHVRSAKGQDFDMEKTIPASSEQLPLQSPKIIRDLYSTSQSSPPIEQHSAVGVSHSKHGNSTHASLQSSVQETIPAFSEQSSVHFTDITQGINTFPETVLPSSQNALEKERQQENTDHNYHRRIYYNNSIQQPETSPQSECYAWKNKGEIPMKETDKTRMEPCRENEITQKDATNSASSSDWLQNAHSESQHEGPNLDDTLTNDCLTDISSPMPNTDVDDPVPQAPNRDVTESAKDTNKKIVILEIQITGFCTICQKSVHKKYSKRHWRMYHAEKIYKCSLCGKAFPVLSSLKRHEKGHTEMYACDQCGFTSTWKYNLATHMRSHREKNPFLCDICKQPFKGENTLAHHVKRFHSNS